MNESKLIQLPNTKQCTRCGKIEFLTEFYNSSRPHHQKKDGLESRCKACINATHKKYTKTGRARKAKRKRDNAYYYSKPGRFNYYQQWARKRNIVWDLTYNQFSFLWQKPCYYCGSKIEYIGIDRKDNDQGYNRENVIACCSICNSMKSTMHFFDFIDHCFKIVEKVSGKTK